MFNNAGNRKPTISKEEQQMDCGITKSKIPNRCAAALYCAVKVRCRNVLLIAKSNICRKNKLLSMVREYKHGALHLNVIYLHSYTIVLTFLINLFYDNK
jgi:hypothetical protein